VLGVARRRSRPAEGASGASRELASPAVGAVCKTKACARFPMDKWRNNAVAGRDTPQPHTVSTEKASATNHRNVSGIRRRHSRCARPFHALSSLTMLPRQVRRAGVALKLFSAFPLVHFVL
jgi:hypothetical protein